MNWNLKPGVTVHVRVDTIGLFAIPLAAIARQWAQLFAVSRGVGLALDHGRMPVELGSLADHKHRSADVASEKARRSQLDSTCRLQFALDATLDDDFLGLDFRCDDSLFLNNQEAFRNDLTLNAPTNP
jgi:hypothetical protein